MPSLTPMRPRSIGCPGTAEVESGSLSARMRVTLRTSSAVFLEISMSDPQKVVERTDYPPSNTDGNE